MAVASSVPLQIQPISPEPPAEWQHRLPVARFWGEQELTGDASGGSVTAYFTTKVAAVPQSFYFVIKEWVIQSNHASAKQARICALTGEWPNTGTFTIVKWDGDMRNSSYNVAPIEDHLPYIYMGKPLVAGTGQIQMNVSSNVDTQLYYFNIRGFVFNREPIISPDLLPLI